jgi:hypothetical protein
VEPVPVQKKPRGHTVHWLEDIRLVRFENEPAGQGLAVTELLPWGQKYPAAHAVMVADVRAVAVQAKPAGHSVQPAEEVRLVRSEKKPTGQAFAVALVEPAGQK